MEVLLFAIVTYIGWGTGDIFGAIAARKIGAYSTSFWVFVAGVIIFSLYTTFALAQLSQLTLTLLLFNLFLGLIFISGNVAFNKALRSSNVSLVGTIASSLTVLTVVLSVIFLKEQILFKQFIQ